MPSSASTAPPDAPPSVDAGPGRAGGPADAPPGLWRRLASMAYEGVLLFGVVMIAGLVYGTLTQQRHALQGSLGLQATLFVVIGLYFVWFWTHGGQTLAMKTWQLRLVGRDGRPVGAVRAVARYLASWLWFLPGLAGVALAGLNGTAPVLAALAANVLALALIARLHPTRQFLHDLLCGTRLVRWQPPPRR